MRRIIVSIIVLISIIPGIDGLKTIRFPGAVEEAEAMNIRQNLGGGLSVVYDGNGNATFEQEI